MIGVYQRLCANDVDDLQADGAEDWVEQQHPFVICMVSLVGMN
jgi:hypothetical protein